MKKSFYSLYGKRLLDVLISFIALLLFTPIFLLSALLIVGDSRGPVFFRQKRLGRHGRIFELLKFRTMTHKPREVKGEIYLDNPEVTPVGRILRRFKIDELPQLINVLCGNMSLVGPRPAMPEQLKEYTEEARKRLLVRPGLTGLAQIRGNIYLSWPERWQYDAQYVDELSFWLDLKIILHTFAVVVLGEEKFLKPKDKTFS